MVDSAYQPNSHASKAAKAVDPAVKKEAPKVEQITTAKVVQKHPSIFKRIGEAFTGDDTQTVGQYLMFDVVVPTVKALVVDLVSQGLERKFYGDGRGRSSGVRTNYSTQFNKPTASSYPGKPTSSAGSNGRREMSERARAAHDFQEIIIGDRGEAERVLDTLQEAINEAGFVSVGNLLMLVGITPAFTDEKYGWFELGRASTVRVREGYQLDMPRPVQLD
jgi:hypothetical protein